MMPSYRFNCIACAVRGYHVSCYTTARNPSRVYFHIIREYHMAPGRGSCPTPKMVMCKKSHIGHILTFCPYM